ncbi:MAG: hypothetical protein ACI4HI_07950 [Lachnospiraceae bacterium]
MKKKIVVWFLIACMFCGFTEKTCFAQNAGMHKEATAEKQTGKFEEASLQEITENKKELCGRKYGTLRVDKDCRMQIPKVKRVGIQEMQTLDAFVEEHPNLMQTLVGDILIQKKDGTKLDIEPGESEYEDKKNQIYCGMADSGFFFFTSQDNRDLNNLKLEKAYDNAAIIGKETNTYELKDGTMTVKQAVKCAEKFLKQWQKQTGDGDYQFEQCSVYQDAGTYIYRLRFQKMENQIPIVSLMPERGSLKTEAFQKAFGMYDLDIYIDSCTGAPFCISNQTMLKEVEEKETYQKLLTPDAAVQCLSEIPLAYRGTKVTSIAVEYLPFSEDKTMKNGEMPPYQEPEQTMFLRPVWKIGMNENSENECYALVDCKTGEVCYKTTEM